MKYLVLVTLAGLMHIESSGNEPPRVGDTFHSNTLQESGEVVEVFGMNIPSAHEYKPILGIVQYPEESRLEILSSQGKPVKRELSATCIDRRSPESPNGRLGIDREQKLLRVVYTCTGPKGAIFDIGYPVSTKPEFRKNNFKVRLTRSESSNPEVRVNSIVGYEISKETFVENLPDIEHSELNERGLWISGWDHENNKTLHPEFVKLLELLAQMDSLDGKTPYRARIHQRDSIYFSDGTIFFSFGGSTSEFRPGGGRYCNFVGHFSFPEFSSCSPAGTTAISNRAEPKGNIRIFQTDPSLFSDDVEFTELPTAQIGQ